MKWCIFIAAVFSFSVARAEVSKPTPGADLPLTWQNEEIPLAIEYSPGKPVLARIKRPSALSGEPLPVLLVFGGFQNAARVLELVAPDRPVVLASFDYPFDPPRKFAFPGSLRFAPDVKRMISDTASGIDELILKLKDRDYVDPTQLTIVGASLGAPFAVSAAARNVEFSNLVVVHGFGDIPATAKHQLVRSWRPKFGWVAEPLAWGLAHFGWWYLGSPSPERDALRLRSSQRVLMISAEADSFIPKDAGEALWEAIQKSPAVPERIIMPGDHLQPGSESLISEIMRRVNAWLKFH